MKPDWNHIIKGDWTLFLDREQVVALMNDEKCFIGAKAWIEFYHFVNGK